MGSSNSFKKVVRVIKNARSYLIDKGLLKKETAPSYFLQSMIYNVPNNLFVGDIDVSVRNVLAYLNGATLSSFKCQNNMQPLFGTTEEQWNEVDARKTINSLVDLWDNWYER